MNKSQKQELVAKVKEKVGEHNFVLAEYKGLTVSELEELRNRLRDVSCELKVVKNRLLNIAFKELNIQGFDAFLKDSTILAVQKDDSFEGLKVLTEFSKGHEKFSIKTARIDSQQLDSERVKSIAELPPKEVLIAQLLSQLQSPITRFVYALKDPMNKLVYALEAIKNTKEKIN
ncbi:MAG: 50S ribosomal protein L10 [Elusimicrobiota bacterium]